MRIVLIVLTLLLTGGCKKEEPAATGPAPPPPVVKADSDRRPVIVAFGDSLTAGFGVDPGLSYPDYLQQEFDDVNQRYHIVNEGISGDTSSGGVSRIASVLAHKPRIVIVELGANDGLRGIPVEETRENLDLVLTEIRKAGVRILLAGITLPRNYGEDYIRQFDRIFPELARKHHVPLLPFLLEGVALNPKLMQKDKLHATAEGNRIVAENVKKALQPLLEKP